jgi:hypothetical protein
MRVTTPAVEIDPSDPFKNDIFERKPFASSLTNLVSTLKEELVICLDAPWGEGKTTFVKMWQLMLSEKGIRNIYFDAFSNDYIDDPFIAVASQILKLAESEFRGDKKKINDYKKKATKVGLQLLSWTTKVGVKAATLGIIKDSDIQELSDIKDDIAKGTSKFISNLIEEKISNFSRESNAIISFKEALSTLSEEINGQTGNPLIVIIDELDRCKPLYAVQLIERIKHFFSVKNVVFLLVMHREQLEESVKCLYGSNINATSYLQKFISFECKLPKNVDPKQIDDYKRYCGRLCKLHEIKTWGDERHLIDCLSTLARMRKLSLRELEKCFAYISLFYSSVSENFLRITPIISFIAVVKVTNPNIYIKLKNGDLGFDEVLAYLGVNENEANSSDDENMKWVIGWIKFCIVSDSDYDNDPELKKFSNYLFRYMTERKGVLPYHCKAFDLFKFD